MSVVVGGGWEKATADKVFALQVQANINATRLWLNVPKIERESLQWRLVSFLVLPIISSLSRLAKWSGFRRQSHHAATNFNCTIDTLFLLANQRMIHTMLPTNAQKTTFMSRWADDSDRH
jgi:hypothetical protein